MKPRFRIAVCRGPECAGKREGNAVHRRLACLIDERALHDRVTLERHSCFGRCRVGPNVHVRQQPSLHDREADRQRSAFASVPPRRRGTSALYSGVGEDDAGDIIELHVLESRIVSRLIHRPDPVPPASRERHPGLATPLARIDLSSHDSTDTGPPTGDTSDDGDTGPVQK